MCIANCFIIGFIAVTTLINLLSGRVLLCSDDDLLKSLEQPSPYCIISGLLNNFTCDWFIAYM